MRNKGYRKGMTVLLLFAISFNLFAGKAEAAEQMTAAEVVEDIKIGWNLGNQLDCTGDRVEGVDVAYYERLHGTPPLDFKLIDMVKEAGYQAVRVPVTYYCHMDKSFQIDKEWLEYLETIVNYVTSQGMYCIINIHHDTGKNGWLRADYSNIEAQKVALQRLWQQIAVHFKDYGDYLLFEGFNEILNNKNQWSYAGKEAYEATNILNQVFVDTVRASGGNNVNRCLIVNTYAASAEEEVVNGFVLPQDTAADRLIVGIHNYQTKGVSRMLTRLNEQLVSKGIPVIICEFGIPNRNNQSVRLQYITEVVLTAREYGMACFWWDDSQTCQNAEDVRNYSLINRRKLTWYFKDLAEYMTTISKW